MSGNAGSVSPRYPIEWERTGTTRDGMPFRIRPIRPEDEDLDRQFIVRLSPQSRYKRMMYSMQEPSPELLHRFVHVDYKRDMAFVALIGEPPSEEMIGVARYAQDRSGPDCEFAVAVADAWQARGVGATLTRLLFEYAHAQGIQKIYGEILADNNQMIDLVHWLGMNTRICPEDYGLIEASVAPV
jgi:acetyltransferase